MKKSYLFRNFEWVWEAKWWFFVVLVDGGMELVIHGVAGRAGYDDEEGAGRVHVPSRHPRVVRPWKTRHGQISRTTAFIRRTCNSIN